jgi:hypothetical protein
VKQLKFVRLWLMIIVFSLGADIGFAQDAEDVAAADYLVRKGLAGTSPYPK